MGAYLSEPITEKISSEGENKVFSFGASSMQGWRVSQEDAHNAILDFDTNTSFWAVYDGHGGAEVSAYCAQKLPDYLKKLDAYKAGDFEKALKDAFIGFDLTLLEPEVIEELKLLAKKNPDIGPEESEEEDDENIADLYNEASMPLRDVLEKYKEKHGVALSPALSRLQQSIEECAKPVSPYLKSARNEKAGGSSASSSSTSHVNVNGGTSSVASSARSGNSSSGSLSASSSTGSSSGAITSGISSDDNDATVSSSSGKIDNSAIDSEQTGNQPDSSSSNNQLTNNASESVPEVSQSSTTKKQPVVSESVTNGDVVCGSSEVITTKNVSEGVSSSSSGVFENGEVSSNTNNGGDNVNSASTTTTTVSNNSISSTAAVGNANTENKLVDSSTDESDEDALEEENSDTEDGEEDADLEELDTEEEEEDMLTEEDEEFMNNMADEPGKDSGCTAVVALIRDNELYVANAGDSRCIICRAGETIEMSLDHKPEDQIEFERIKKAGGRVTLDGRVNGGLNLSRAIGDHGYKTNKDLPPEEQMISALPDIKRLTLTPQDEFMVLACDGIWNFMTSEDVVKFVKTKLQENPKIKLTKVCEELFDYCLAPNTMGDGTGCDNMTAIIVRFNKNIPVDCGMASSSNSTTAQKRTANEINVPDESDVSDSAVQNASKRMKVSEDENKPTTQDENELSSSNNGSTAADQAPIIDTSS